MSGDGSQTTAVGRGVSRAEPAQVRIPSQVLRPLLWAFILMAAAIALITFTFGTTRGVISSVVACAVYILLLLVLPRWGSRRVGYLCTVALFFLAAGAMATGRGIYDITMVLFPAVMLMGTLFLRQGHQLALIVLPVVTVALVGLAQTAGLPLLPGAPPATAADVAVVTLLLLVTGVLTRLLVRSLQVMIAERQEAEEAAVDSKRELERRHEALELVNELAHRLHRGLDLEAIAAETVDVMIRHSRPPMVSFYLLDDGGTRLRMIADHGFTAEEQALGATLPVDGSLSGIALREQRVVHSEDIGADHRAEPAVRKALAARGLSSTLCIPLEFDGQVSGTVNLIYPGQRSFSPLELDTFQAVGQAVALAVSNVRHVADLEHQAYHDATTGLANRAGLHRRFPAVAAACGDGAGLAVLLLDLDRFRVVNDALGHHAADRLLTQIGARLGKVASDHDGEVFRLGGDEFALVCVPPDEVAGGEALAHRALESLGPPFAVDGMALEVRASIGVACYPVHGRDSHALLRCADVAMYRAKQIASGVATYSSELDLNTPERLAMLSELGLAIRDGRLLLHYQPKVSLETGAVVGFEALVRWPHPSRGLLQPAEFLPLVESHDLIQPLTYWVVEAALEQLCRWRTLGPDLTMAVNLSARNLLDRNCAQRLDEIIRRIGVAPERLEFELTETAIMTDEDAAQTVLGRITATGARLAIDDFGTGYSSLTYLKRFPVHTIKIDRSFVSDLAAGEQSRAIVRLTVELAHSLGLNVVAEGIEDEATAAALRAMGCELAQGFYFARPAPAGEAELCLDGRFRRATTA